MKSGLSQICVLGGLCLFGTAATAAEFQTVGATVETVGTTATIAGTVIPYKEVTLSAQIPGQINLMAGREGDSFTSGTPLIGIADDKIRARRDAIVAQIMSAQAALSNAQVQYSRELWSPRINQGLSRSTGMGVPAMFDRFFTRPFASASGLTNPYLQRYADLQGQVSGVQQANSALLSARARLDEIDARLRDARLNAPFDGIITKKMVEIGDTVQPGQPLVKFAYVGYLRIQAEVPVRLVAGLRRGMFVPAKLDALGQPVKARVAQIYPIADSARHTVTVKFDLPRGVPGGPGMYAELQLPDTSRPGARLATVPRSALIQRGSLPGVYVLKDGRPALRLVRVGGPVGKDRVTILSGLDGSEQIIVTPPNGAAATSIARNQ